MSCFGAFWTIIGFISVTIEDVEEFERIAARAAADVSASTLQQRATKH
jgi:hypothetical protein